MYALEIFFLEKYIWSAALLLYFRHNSISVNKNYPALHKERSWPIISEMKLVQTYGYVT